MAALLEEGTITGFWSYARQDDLDSNGNLSALRKAIQASIRSQLGVASDRFSIFQDREAIAYGKRWENEITAASRRAMFFIPIVTPTAIKSGQCLKEFELFLAREKALGRDDLIFPMLYLRTPQLDGAEYGAMAEVARVIKARQYDDWSEIRHLPIDNHEVKKRIDGFAAGIVRALEKDASATQERPATKANGQPPGPYSPRRDPPPPPSRWRVRSLVIALAVLIAASSYPLYLVLEDRLLWKTGQSPVAYLERCRWPCFYETRANLAVALEDRDEKGALLKTAEDDLLKARQEIDNATAEIAELRENARALQATVDATATELNDAKQKLGEAETAIATRDRKIVEIGKEAAALKQAIDRTAEELRETQGKLEGANADIVARDGKIEEQETRLAELSDELSREKTTAAATLAELRNALVGAGQQLSARQTELEASAAKIAALEKAAVEITELKENVHALQTTVDAIAAELNEAKAKLGEAATEIAARDGKIVEIGKEAATLKQTIESIVKEFRETQAKLDGANADIVARNGKIEEQGNRLAELTDELDREKTAAAKTLAESSNALAVAGQQLSARQTELEAKAAKIAALEKQIVEFGEKLRATAKVQEDTRSELAREVERGEELALKNEALEHAAKEGTAELADRLAEANAALEARDRRIGTLNRDVEDLRGSIDAFSERVKEFSSQLAKSKEALSERDREIAALSDQIANRNTALEVRDGTIADLRGQLSAAEQARDRERDASKMLSEQLDRLNASFVQKERAWQGKLSELETALGAALVQVERLDSAEKRRRQEIAEQEARCDALAANPDDWQKPANVAGVKRDEIGDAAAAVAACTLTARGPGASPRQLYQLGRALEKNGQAREAFDAFAEAGKAGYALASYNAGMMFVDRGEELGCSKGDDCERRALPWLKQADRQGAGIAARRLGLWSKLEKPAIECGTTAACMNAALILFTRAYGGNYKRAAFDIAGLYYYDFSNRRFLCQQDCDEQAFSWYERARVYEPYAIYRLGEYYLKGHAGSRCDAGYDCNERAKQQFELASESSEIGASAPAMFQLGKLHDEYALRQCQNNRDWCDAEAARWYERAALLNGGEVGKSARLALVDLYRDNRACDGAQACQRLANKWAAR